MTQPNNPVNSPDAGDQLVLNSPEEAKSPKDFALWAGVIVLIAMTLYSPALFGKFLWDDNRHVEENRNLTSAEGLFNIWTKFGLQHGGTVQYYPLTHTTYWLEYQISGARPGEINTTIFHVDNVLLHCIGAVLLWFVLRELAVPGAWVVAAIWALHPIQAESVAWISERKNVLAGVFFFASILTYLKSGFGLDRDSGLPDSSPSSPEIRDYSLYAASLALFILAMFSKTVACSMPAVVLLLIWWKRERLTGRDVLALLPFFVIGIGMAAVTSHLERSQIGASGAEWDLSLLQRILIASRAVWFYAGKLLFPASLSFIYPRWNVDPGQGWQWLFPIALLAALAALFALRGKFGRGPLVAALVFCGVLVPALGFLNFYPMRYSFVADHFQYLAGPALIALIVSALAIALRKIAASAKVAPYAVAGIVLVVLCVLTAVRAKVFASPIDLWADTAAKSPNSWMVRNNYGTALWLSALDLTPDRADQARQWLDESTHQFDAALKIKPDHERAWNNWGQVLLVIGKPDEAADRFQHALQLNGKNVDALMGLGRAQYDQKKYDDALATYRKALAEAEAQKPYTSRATAAAIFHFTGDILKAKGDLDGAAAQYAKAIDLVKDSAEYRYDAATLLAQMGKKVEAAAQYGSAIELRPDFIEARIDLAKLMISVDNLNGAREQLIASARINKAYPPLMDAAKLFDAAVKKREATTKPSTTRATTAPTTTQWLTDPANPALKQLQKVGDIRDNVHTMPATQPIK